MTFCTCHSLLTALVVVLTGTTAYGQNPTAVNVIPRPGKLELAAGTFALQSGSLIVADKVARPTAEFLAESLARLTGFVVPVRSGTPPAGCSVIQLAIEPGLAEPLCAEGYRLVVRPEQATLTASTAAGLFYAVQTLRQLLPQSSPALTADAKRSWTMPCLKIEDRPRFPWRGLMLDPGRFFLSKKLLKRYIDVMAMYKMNRLHLHLTDYEGWTVEIKKYPALTDIARWPLKLTDRVRSFYTQDDMRELVAYATARHVMIIPEIEMPGHNAIPAMAYRQEVLCPNNPYRSGEKAWDNDAYKWLEPCLASPKALELYQNILKEVIALFPSSYIHLGGDEYFGLAWEQCPDCKGVMAAQRLRETDDGLAKPLFAVCQGSKEKYLLYRWWMTRMCDFVRAQGRQPVLWDDMSWRGKFPKDAVIMQWHCAGVKDAWQLVDTPENPAAEAALAGRDAIVAPVQPLYFDCDCTVEAVYGLEPIPTGLAADKQQHILGPHAPVWNQPENRVDGQVFPRFYALAELGWTPRERRDWPDFSKRLSDHAARGASMADAIVLGRWTPADMLPQEKRVTLRWNAARQVVSPGVYQAILDYQSGADGINIESVILREDDKEIARDAHHGWSGAVKTDNTYTLNVDAVEPAAVHTVEAQVWIPQGGTDSSGVVWIRAKE